MLSLIVMMLGCKKAEDKETSEDIQASQTEDISDITKEPVYDMDDPQGIYDKIVALYTGAEEIVSEQNGGKLPDSYRDMGLKIVDFSRAINERLAAMNDDEVKKLKDEMKEFLNELTQKLAK